MRFHSKTRDDSNKMLNQQAFNQTGLPIIESLTLHISGYLRHMLEKYEESEFVKYLIAPSPQALTGYFCCDEEGIYAALHELKRQGYEYETSGSTGPIILWDPLIRRTARQQIS